MWYCVPAGNCCAVLVDGIVLVDCPPHPVAVLCCAVLVDGIVLVGCPPHPVINVRKQTTKKSLARRSSYLKATPSVGSAKAHASTHVTCDESSIVAPLFLCQSTCCGGLRACSANGDRPRRCIAYNLIAAQRDQVFLFPSTLTQWFPSEHQVYQVIDAVEALEMEPFLRRYNAEGAGRTAENRTSRSAFTFAICSGAPSAGLCASWPSMLPIGSSMIAIVSARSRRCSSEAKKKASASVVRSPVLSVFLNEGEPSWSLAGNRDGSIIDDDGVCAGRAASCVSRFKATKAVVCVKDPQHRFARGGRAIAQCIADLGLDIERQHDAVAVPRASAFWFHSGSVSSVQEIRSSRRQARSRRNRASSIDLAASVARNHRQTCFPPTERSGRAWARAVVRAERTPPALRP